MVPLAEWCLQSGDTVPKLIERMETGAGGRVRVAPSVFRVLEGMYDPDDFADLTRELDNDKVKLTASRVKEVAAIIRRRQWRWVLTHPGFENTDVHPSRRVSPCEFSFSPPVTRYVVTR